MPPYHIKVHFALFASLAGIRDTQILHARSANIQGEMLISIRGCPRRITLPSHCIAEPWSPSEITLLGKDPQSLPPSF